MPELALDDVQRHALAQQFECVRVPRLVRGEPSTDPGPGHVKRARVVSASPDDLATARERRGRCLRRRWRPVSVSSSRSVAAANPAARMASVSVPARSVKMTVSLWVPTDWALWRS